ncbi:MAG: hypothetical protein SV760_10445, partial [Halobacteria archaeon]|nr:hypothetical protein [Halobacteria archaeon]
SVNATHMQEIDDGFEEDDVVTAEVNSKEEVMDGIRKVLEAAAKTESEREEVEA